MKTVELLKGLSVGNVEHKTATLREPTAGDLIAAMTESERVVSVNGEPTLLLSNTALSINTLRRQVVTIGDIHGPLESMQLALLSGTDLALLQQAADELDVAVAKEMSDRGRDQAASKDAE